MRSQIKPRVASRVAISSRQPASSGVTDGREINCSASSSVRDMENGESVAKQIVQCSLHAGLRIDTLDDHGAIEAVLAVRRRKISGNNNRTGRDATIENL